LDFSEVGSAGAAVVCNPANDIFSPSVRCPVDARYRHNCARAIGYRRSSEIDSGVIRVPRVYSISAAPRIEWPNVPITNKRELAQITPISADGVVVEKHDTRARAADESVKISTNVSIVVNLNGSATARPSDAFGSVIGYVAIVNHVVSYDEPRSCVCVAHAALETIRRVCHDVIFKEQELR